MPVRPIVTRKRTGFVRNTIVTRGMGPHQNLVRQGFTRSSFEDVIETIRFGGQSGTKRALRELEEVVISARLVRVNDKPPPTKLSGFVRVKVNHDARYAVSIVEHLGTRVREAWEMFKVTIKRIK